MKLGLGILVLSFFYLPLNAEEGPLPSFRDEPKSFLSLRKRWWPTTLSPDELRSELPKICTRVFMNMVEASEELTDLSVFIRSDLARGSVDERDARLLKRKKLVRELADAAEAWNHLDCQTVLDK